jgi:flagellar protein FlaJ
MNIDVLRNTIRKEKKLLEELNLFLEQRKNINEKERMFFDKSIFSLIHQFSILNDSIAEFLDRKEPKKLIVPKYSRVVTKEGKFYVPKVEKEQFLQDLKIEKSLIAKIKRKARSQEKEKKIEGQGFKRFQRTEGIISIANSLFGPLAFDLSRKSKSFEGLKYSLRKANMPFLLSAYLSLMFFFTFLSFFIGLSFAFLISILSQAGVLIFIRNIALSFLLPVIVFISFYYYPNSKISGTKQEIENELPFATVHMSAIATSGVSPDKIFRILALSEEYKNIAKESRKIVNQINIYGYDLTTALRNVATITSNKKFAELLNGISATITSGGNLSSYLNEKAKDNLIDYKLSREKYATTIAMFADIYTALLIAAPLIFMLILVIVGSLGTGLIGLDPSSLSTIGIVVIAILNVIFLIFLEITQPKM